VLAIVYDHFKATHKREAKKKRVKTYTSLVFAFQLLQGGFDGTSELSKEAFVALVLKVQPGTSEEEAGIMFDVLDLDGSGQITIAEFLRLPVVLKLQLPPGALERLNAAAAAAAQEEQEMLRLQQQHGAIHTAEGDDEEHPAIGIGIGDDDNKGDHYVPLLGRAPSNGSINDPSPVAAATTAPPRISLFSARTAALSREHLRTTTGGSSVAGSSYSYHTAPSQSGVNQNHAVGGVPGHTGPFASLSTYGIGMGGPTDRGCLAGLIRTFKRFAHKVVPTKYFLWFSLAVVATTCILSSLWTLDSQKEFDRCRCVDYVPLPTDDDPNGPNNGPSGTCVPGDNCDALLARWPSYAIIGLLLIQLVELNLRSMAYIPPYYVTAALVTQQRQAQQQAARKAAVPPPPPRVSRLGAARLAGLTSWRTRSQLWWSFASWWNLLDVCIVWLALVSQIAILLDVHTKVSLEVADVFEVVGRAFIYLRLVTLMPRLRKIAHTVGSIASLLSHFVMVYLAISYGFVIVGMAIFGGAEQASEGDNANPPAAFCQQCQLWAMDTFPRAWLVILQLAVGNNWNSVLMPNLAYLGTYWGAWYFCFYRFFLSDIVLNVIEGVMIETYETSVEEAERAKEADRLALLAEAEAEAEERRQRRGGGGDGSGGSSSDGGTGAMRMRAVRAALATRMRRELFEEVSEQGNASNPANNDNSGATTSPGVDDNTSSPINVTPSDSISSLSGHLLSGGSTPGASGGDGMLVVVADPYAVVASTNPMVQGMMSLQATAVGNNVQRRISGTNMRQDSRSSLTRGSSNAALPTATSSVSVATAASRAVEGGEIPATPVSVSQSVIAAQRQQLGGGAAPPPPPPPRRSIVQPPPSSQQHHQHAHHHHGEAPPLFAAPATPSSNNNNNEQQQQQQAAVVEGFTSSTMRSPPPPPPSSGRKSVAFAIPDASSSSLSSSPALKTAGSDVAFVVPPLFLSSPATTAMTPAAAPSSTSSTAASPAPATSAHTHSCSGRTARPSLLSGTGSASVSAGSPATAGFRVDGTGTGSGGRSASNASTSSPAGAGVGIPGMDAEEMRMLEESLRSTERELIQRLGLQDKEKEKEKAAERQKPRGPRPSQAKVVVPLPVSAPASASSTSSSPATTTTTAAATTHQAAAGQSGVDYH
jgi:Ion transport protein